MTELASRTPKSPIAPGSEPVAIAALVPADSPRSGEVDLAYARSLMEVRELPPILVCRRTMRVIDGMHRLTAATLDGRADIDVRYFDGDEKSVRRARRVLEVPDVASALAHAQLALVEKPLARELLADGRLGQLVAGDVWFTRPGLQDGLFADTGAQWMLSPSWGGRGASRILGSCSSTCCAGCALRPA
jgi:hypothetical protein